MSPPKRQSDARLLDLPYCSWVWRIAEPQVRITRCAYGDVCQAEKIHCNGSSATGWLSLLTPERADSLRAEVLELLQRQDDFHLRLQLMNNDQAHHMVLHGIVSERDAHGLPLHVVGISRQEAMIDDPVTAMEQFTSNALEERRKLESMLANAQRFADIAEISGSVAHDLNNLLSPIRMSVELLRRKLKDSQVDRYVEIIEESTGRARAVVQQLLSFAKDAGREQFEPVAVNDIVRELEKLTVTTFPQRIKLQFEYEESLPQLHLNPGQLHQALLNLLINARDAIAAEGMIRVITSHRDLNMRVTVGERTLAPGRYVCISVEDTGCGIPKAMQVRIFDPFFTTKKNDKGTGLGLSSVYGIVANAGGYIDLESTPGEGSVFHIILPSI